MKKLSILLLLPFFIACSSDNNEPDNIKLEIPKEEAQDHTSIVFVYDKKTDLEFVECLAAYYAEDGRCLKLGELGAISDKQISKEIKIDIDTLTRVYLFTNIKDANGEPAAASRVVEPFILKKETIKNVFNFANKKTQWVSGSGLNDYPH